VDLCAFSVDLCVTDYFIIYYTECHKGDTEDHRGLHKITYILEVNSKFKGLFSPRQIVCDKQKITVELEKLRAA